MLYPMISHCMSWFLWNPHRIPPDWCWWPASPGSNLQKRLAPEEIVRTTLMVSTCINHERQIYDEVNDWLVVSTPLKNMSSSVGVTIPNRWKVIKAMFQMFQTTNQSMIFQHLLFSCVSDFSPDVSSSPRNGWWEKICSKSLFLAG